MILAKTAALYTRCFILAACTFEGVLLDLSAQIVTCALVESLVEIDANVFPFCSLAGLFEEGFG